MSRLIRTMAPERPVTQSVVGETRTTLICNCHFNMNAILDTIAILMAAAVAAVQNVTV